MKQVHNFFFIFIMYSTFATASLHGMQQLQKKLRDLTVSLQTLSNKLQQSSVPATTPSQKKFLRSDAAPEFVKYETGHYAPHAGSGFAFFFIGLTSDNSQPPFYNLILYGPRLENPTEQDFNKIIQALNSRKSEDEIIYYPGEKAKNSIQFNNKNEVEWDSKASINLIKAENIKADYEKNQQIEQAIRPYWQDYDKKIKQLGNAPYYLFPGQGIYATKEETDKQHIDKIIEISNNLFDHITTKNRDQNIVLAIPYQDITDLNLINTIINDVEIFRGKSEPKKGLISRFKKELDDYIKKLAPEGISEEILKRTIIPTSKIVSSQQIAKFGKDYSKKDLLNKAKEYHDNTKKRLEDPLNGSLVKMDKILELLNAKKKEIENTLNAPLRKYYQKLINEIGKEPSTQYASTQAAVLGGLKNITKERPHSAYIPKTAIEKFLEAQSEEEEELRPEEEWLAGEEEN